MISAAGWALAAALALTGSAWAQTPPPAATPQPAPAAAPQPATTATPQPPTTVAGITVPGKPPEAFHDRYVQSLRFVRSHGVPATSGQLARWTDTVCPVTVGLSPAMNRRVSETIEDLAGRVGAPALHRSRCSANIEILFTDQPQQLIDLVAKKRSQLLGFHFVSQIQAVTRITQPIQAWYLTSSANRMNAGTLDLHSNHWPSEGCGGFTGGRHSVFTNILIVADANALDGQPIEPVAAYIAVLALAQAKGSTDCAEQASILDTFAPACAGQAPPQGVTSADTGYLKALYGSNSELCLWLSRSTIAERMVRGAADSTKP